MALRRWTALVAMATVAAVSACSSKTDSGGGTINATDLKGMGGGGAAGADNSAAAPGLIITGSAGTAGSGSGLTAPPTTVCGGQAFKAEPEPVDMYIMFDQSSSMADQIPNSNPPITWWQAAQTGVTGFVNDPRAAGAQPGQPAMGVGLQFFPLNGIAPQSCMADYKTPEVEVGLLPGNAAAVAASIQKHQPTAFTPTAPALQGAIAHMKEWGPAHVGRAPVVVLVTDGFPTECDPQDITDIATIVQNAFNTEPKVRTFVVGFNLGPGGSNLDALAEAGGTGKPFLIDKGDIGAQFVDAMLSISSTTLQCKFDLPAPPANMSLDINMVAVTYTPSATGVEAQVPKLTGLSDCDINMGNGWFFDSPTNPTKILVCPATCAKFAAGVVKTSSACLPVPGIH
jgi:hypothetical protein